MKKPEQSKIDLQRNDLQIKILRVVGSPDLSAFILDFLVYSGNVSVLIGYL